MAKYQPVSPRFWQDPKVRRWPDHQKLLGAYLLTCPHRTSEGLFWLPHGYVAQDLGWSIERVSEGYSGLKEAGFCAYDDTSETVLLLKALKYQAPAGAKQIQGAVNRLADVPPSPLFALLRDAAEEFAPEFCKALDDAFESGLLKHHRYPTDTPPGGYPLARARSSSSSSSSNSTSSSKVNTVVDPATPDRPGTLPTDAAIRQVWETYLDACQQVGISVNARLTPKRRDKIRTRLKAFPLQDVLDAAQGWILDPWPERRRNCDAALIFRSDEQVEKFRNLWRDGPPAQISNQAAQAMRTSAAMRARREEVNRRAGLQRMERAGGPAQHGLPTPAN